MQALTEHSLPKSEPGTGIFLPSLKTRGESVTREIVMAAKLFDGAIQPSGREAQRPPRGSI